MTASCAAAATAVHHSMARLLDLHLVLVACGL